MKVLIDAKALTAALWRRIGMKWHPVWSMGIKKQCDWIQHDHDTITFTEFRIWNEQTCEAILCCIPRLKWSQAKTFRNEPFGASSMTKARCGLSRTPTIETKLGWRSSCKIVTSWRKNLWGELLPQDVKTWWIKWNPFRKYWQHKRVLPTWINNNLSQIYLLGIES